MKDKRLIIIGASARAAAESARRAGYAIYWLDQFGDVDVKATGPGQRIPAGTYPDAIPMRLAAAPAVPFLYTGAMENHTEVLAALEQLRPLLGNGSQVCQKLHDHQDIAELIARHKLPVARVVAPSSAQTHTGKWLEKPVCGAGGAGIRDYRYGGPHRPGEAACYLQQFIAGESRSAVFISNGSECELLGVSAQLVGLPACNATPYSYCGSVGPLTISAREYENWQQLGRLLVRAFCLLGLFGIDAIVTGDAVYLVEINPRYTASVEVYELAYGINTIERHERACHGQPLPAWDRPPATAVAPAIIGKGYLFAASDLNMPDPRLMQARLGLDGRVRFADLPHPGQPIMAGQPMMSLLIRRADAAEAYADLLHAADRISDYCLP